MSVLLFNPDGESPLKSVILAGDEDEKFGMRKGFFGKHSRKLTSDSMSLESTTSSISSSDYEDRDNTKVSNALGSILTRSLSSSPGATTTSTTVERRLFSSREKRSGSNHVHQQPSVQNAVFKSGRGYYV